ncbi:MAG: MATE family efflux transporter [Myxococcota bacterium]
MSSLESVEEMSARRVLKLAWPVMLSMLSYSVMSAADAVFVGRLGTAPLAAIGLSVTTVWLFLAMPHGLVRGLRVATAQATGAGRHAVADALGWQAVWLALGTGVIVAIASALGPRVFDALGATPAVAEEALRYFRIRALFAPVALLALGLTAWFEGRGDTKTPMRANVTANLLNVALDAVLVTGLGPVPAFGIEGAAWAGVVSLGTAAVWLFAKAWPTLRTVRARPRRALLGESGRLGLPIGAQRLLDIVAWTVLSGVLASLGDAQLAAHVLAVRVLLVSFLPGMAIAEATAVLVGQSVGAGRPDDARAAYRAGTGAAVALMSAGAVVFVAFPDALIAPFGAGPDVAPIARHLLWVAAAFQIVDAIATVTFFALDGAGDTRFTLVASIAMSWGLKLPLGVALATLTGLGAVGAWLGLTAELVALLLLLGWRWRSGRWYAAAPA